MYAIECGVCGIQYVGQTRRTLRQRIFEHINEIIHQLPEDNYDLALVPRRTKESQWISKLGTAWSNGLNIRS